MTMLHVYVDAACLFFVLHAHFHAVSPRPGCMSMYSTYCKSMSMRHVHVHSAYPSLHADVHVVSRLHAACPCCMYMLFFHSVFPCSVSMSPCCMLHIRNECPYCMSKLHVQAAFPSCMSTLYVHSVCADCISTACLCCMSMLHAHAERSCSMYILQIHAACPC
jgi:hypothetical protein